MAKKDTTQYVPPSNADIYRPFGGWNGFMHSHGLKTWNLDDVEEGKQIVEQMKENDKMDWEEEQAEKAEKASTSKK
jgi:hypothetical protein